MPLHEILAQPVFVSILFAILLAFLSAYLTLRSNIRQRAWLMVYQEKRAEIREFIQTLDGFASTVMYAGEVLSVKERPLLAQLAGLLFWGRRIWGADPGGGKDPIGRTFIETIPTIGEVMARKPEAANRAQSAIQLLINVLEERLELLFFRMGQLRTTLAITLRDPDVTKLAQQTVAKMYERIHSTTPAYQDFDFEAFALEWSKDMTPIKLSLRRDLEKSSKSLGAALRLSLRFRLRRTRVGKWLLGKAAKQRM